MSLLRERVKCSWTRTRPVIFPEKKSKKMSVKLTSMKKPVQDHIHDGDYIVIGDFGANRIPLEVVHEIVRQRARKRCYRRSGNGSPVCSAQIDAYGNLNSTVIGDYNAPKVRLPGRGGANDFASFCWRTMVITPQDKRRFVEKVDFITTPGWLSGGNSRDESGMPLGTVPYRIITNMAIIGFEEKSKRMIVLSLNPGSTKAEVQENCGFEQLWSEDLSETSLPTPEELDILRNRVDPKGYIINR